MNKEIEILTPNGVQTIKSDSLFIIAEVGNQFGGKLDTALELAKVAHEVGADAVKYIFWFPDEIMADKSQMYTYETIEGTKTEPMFDLLDRLRLSLLEWQEVATYCSKLGIIFTTTINCPSAFEWATQLCLPVFKLSSWDWNLTDLWEWCAASGLPTIADMGPVTKDELRRNVKIFLKAQNKNLALLQCFHTKQYAEMNMNTLSYLRDSYGCLMGYSANDCNDDLDILSIGLGGCILEKRLTLSRKGGILHDVVSKEPNEFKEYVTKMRNLKSSLGCYNIAISQEDRDQRQKWFRHIVADEFIPKGSTILRPMLEAKRGEFGVSPEYMDNIVGKKATRDIERNEALDYSDIATD